MATAPVRHLRWICSLAFTSAPPISARNPSTEPAKQRRSNSNSSMRQACKTGLAARCSHMMAGPATEISIAYPINCRTWGTSEREGRVTVDRGSRNRHGPAPARDVRRGYLHGLRDHLHLRLRAAARERADLVALQPVHAIVEVALPPAPDRGFRRLRAAKSGFNNHGGSDKRTTVVPWCTMMIKSLRNLTKNAICSTTKDFPGGQAGQGIRQALIPHRMQIQKRACPKDRLLDLHDTYADARCLIIGGAPSLKELDLSVIRADYTFLLNRAYLFENRPSTGYESLVISNPHAFQEYGQEALTSELHAAFLSGEIDTSTHEDDKRIIGFQQWEQPRIHNGFFQFDLHKPLYDGSSVAFTAIQLAVWLGFREIILAGIDFDFDPHNGHFYGSSDHEKLRTRGISVRNSTKMINSLSYCCRILNEIGRSKIVSVSPNRGFDFLEYRTPEEFET